MKMRRLVAVAVVGLAVGVAADAQRGGGGHAGGGGGFHGGGGFASHGGGVRVGTLGGGSRPAGQGGYAPRYGGQGRGWVTGRGAGVAGVRPEFYHREGERRRDWRGGYGGGYGYGVAVGYGDYGWLDADDPGTDGGYDQGYGQPYEAGYDQGYQPGPGGYDAGAAQDGPAEASGGQGNDAGEPPIPFTAGGGRARGYAATVGQGGAYDIDSVTLVFKDGRAPETIHNYALTRTTLYVTDGRRREIPVASLDLAATEKVNRAAGVRFQLPVAP